MSSSSSASDSRNRKDFAARRSVRRYAFLAAFTGLALCTVAACSGVDATTSVDNHSTITSSSPVTMTVQGRGNFLPLSAVSGRYTGEIAVRGTTAYTTTWGNTSAQQSAFYVWDVSTSTPTLTDSVKVDSATTLGDIAVSDDGSVLVVATERSFGSIVVYSLANPRKPVRLSRFMNAGTSFGVHTAEIGRVNGKLYGFLSIDPGSVPAQLIIVDLSDPANPRQIFQQYIGTPYVHDTFVRDGLLYLALWNDGVAIWDIGGGTLGGSPSAPKEIGRVRTINGEVHNIWWLKDPVTGNTKYAFIGEEGFGTVGVSSIGDVHVVDVSTMSSPKEVAFYNVVAAGTHNFSVDEANGILYAAYYNGGIRALDVRGDLGTCTDAQKSFEQEGTGAKTAMCDLRKMGRELGIGLTDRGIGVYIWGVQYLGGAVYASDMINGIWKLAAVARN